MKLQKVLKQSAALGLAALLTAAAPGKLKAPPAGSKTTPAGGGRKTIILSDKHMEKHLWEMVLF